MPDIVYYIYIYYIYYILYIYILYIIYIIYIHIYGTPYSFNERCCYGNFLAVGAGLRAGLLLPEVGCYLEIVRSYVRLCNQVLMF